MHQGSTMTEAQSTFRRRAVIVDPLGLHMRCAARLVTLAQSFRSGIRVTAKGHTADGKSLLDLAILAAECGTELDIQAQGPDAEEAVSALADLVAAGLDADGPESNGGEPHGQG
jgi:phosphocarrier protein HPr